MDDEKINEEVRAFKRKWMRQIVWMYWAVMFVYGLAAVMFIRDGNWGSAIQMFTLAALVSGAVWFTRALARIRGDL